MTLGDTPLPPDGKVLVFNIEVETASTSSIPLASCRTQDPTHIAITKYTRLVNNIAKNVPFGMDFEASWK